MDKKNISFQAKGLPIGELTPPVDSGTSNLTLSSRTLVKIRNDILSGDLSPDAPLKMGEISKRYAVGYSPVREALFQLATEGLVTISNRRGFRVAGMSASEIIEVTRIRQWLERLAIQDSFQHGDTKWEASVVSSFHILSRSSEDDLNFDRVHYDFHEALVSACHLSTLHRFRRQLIDVSRRYRKLAWTLGANWDDDISEHEKILHAALARDTNLAVNLMDFHLETTVNLVLKVLQKT